jgi:anti-sigma regulatory factor (Ser/Thr protein kinase)
MTTTMNGNIGTLRVESRPPRPVTSGRRLAVLGPVPRTTQSVAGVRRQVRDLMRRWDLPHLAGDAEFLTSELAANAVQHATGTQYTVAVAAAAGRLLVEVLDADPRLPVVRELDPARERGRALATLTLLADA